MKEPPIGRPRSPATLHRLFAAGARWTTSTADEIASVRFALLRMADHVFIEVLRLLTSGDYCAPEILHALARTPAFREQMRKVGFIPPLHPPDRHDLHQNRPTRAREVIAKLGLEPKRPPHVDPPLPRVVQIGTTRGVTRRIELDRSALFDLVWSEPVEKLAKSWGLSDRGLAKACARLKIPVPPRGYWAKVQHGRKLGRPLLPDLRQGEAEQMVLRVPDL